MIRVKGFTSPLSRMAVVVFCLMAAATLFAPYLSRYNPLTVNMEDRLQPPSFEHLFGTDALGRDFYSRLIHGGRVSIVLSIAVTAMAMAVGLAAGVAGGYFGGLPDKIILGITNLFMGLPGMTLMIAVAGILGPGINTVLIALSITGWMGFSRIVRGETIKIKQEAFIEATRAMGGGHGYLILHHIIPNIRAVLLVTFATKISWSMITISSLSYLGFGLEPPAPDWGVMVKDALNYFRSAPRLIVAPGLCICLLTFSINIIGDSLRDFFDARHHPGRG